MNAILDMRGAHQRPDPNKLHIPTRIRLEPAVPIDMGGFRPARNEDAPRRSHLRRDFFLEHGYTEGCEGCKRLATRMSKAIIHREECRSRMYAGMKKTEKRQNMDGEGRDKYFRVHGS